MAVYAHCLYLVALLLLLCRDAAAKGTLITSLPGFSGPIPFPVYGGYLSVSLNGTSAAQELYHLYVPSEATSKGPVLYWAGGPCSVLSSVLAGIGPFRVNSSGDVSVNPYRWSRTIDIVFVDVPGCASDGGSVQPCEFAESFDALGSAQLTAAVTAVQAAYPSVRGRPVWFGGDGYASHIVLPSALEVHPAGVVLFSPIVSPSTLGASSLKTARARDILSFDQAAAINSSCSVLDVAEVLLRSLPLAEDLDVAEVLLRSLPLAEDPAAQYGFTKDFGSCGKAMLPWVSGLSSGSVRTAFWNFYADQCSSGDVAATPDGAYDPCARDHAAKWYAASNVKVALGIRPMDGPSQGAPGFCNVALWAVWPRSDKLKDLSRTLATVAGFSRVLVVNGDAGGLPAYSDAAAWAPTLHLQETAPWLLWYANSNNCQLGGYATTYRGLTLTSIRFAGLFPAWDQALRSYAVMRRFVVDGLDNLGGKAAPYQPKNCSIDTEDPVLPAPVMTPKPQSRAAVPRPPIDGQKPVQLPDSPTLSFNQYTGYAPRIGSPGAYRNMFYWFIESKSKPETAPIALWLQGGPGCSGLFGMFSEIGPLAARADGGSVKLVERSWTWNDHMNVLVIESPVCVGFSYVDGDQDLCNHINDTITAHDNLYTLVGFFSLFPSLKKNPFFITGESFAGHYIPDLSVAIIDYNAGASPEDRINFVGLTAGNPLTVAEIDMPNDIDRWADTPIIPQATVDGLNAHCTVDMIAGFQAGPCNEGTCTEHEKKIYGISDACWPYLVAVTPGVGQPGNMNFAAPNVDVCPVVHDDYQNTANTPYDPCGVNSASTYLSRSDVQKALGVAPQLVGQPWQSCSNPVNLGYSFQSIKTSQLANYQKIIASTPPKAVLVYTGDIDEIISYLSSNSWTKQIGKNPTVERHSWSVNTNGMQVAGFVTQYEGLSYATLRGAGHEVPSFQPQRAYCLENAFIAAASGTLNWKDFAGCQLDVNGTIAYMTSSSR